MLTTPVWTGLRACDGTIRGQENQHMTLDHFAFSLLVEDTYLTSPSPTTTIRLTTRWVSQRHVRHHQETVHPSLGLQTNSHLERPAKNWSGSTEYTKIFSLGELLPASWLKGFFGKSSEISSDIFLTSQASSTELRREVTFDLVQS